MAFMMVSAFMILIMTGRLSAIVALILVPTAFGMLLGFGSSLGVMMLQGIKDLAPTGVMLLFAILYFGLMIDAGLFEPLTKRVVAWAHGDPVKIVVGTAIVAMVVSLDGDGATTYIITCAAMIPLYRSMGMDLRKMAAVIILSGAVMNVLPWGGPTARVLSALNLDAEAVFIPMIPAMVATAVWVLFAAWCMGIGERDRLARHEQGTIIATNKKEAYEEAALPQAPARRPRIFWFNLVLTATMMVALVADVMPLTIIFMLAFALALPANCPRLRDQQARIATHAGNALSVAGMIFAAGIFTGILSGTGMVDALSRSVTAMVPAELGPDLAPITALLSAPFTYFISNDAFYFGVLPILAATSNEHAIPIADVGRAALVGQQIHLLSPLVPSTFLLIGLAGIEFADLMRATFKWAVGSTAVFFAVSLLTGSFAFG